ncbi:hypothetical protein [Gimesia aquarii]|uniref:Uncharacterized protein n=1 Tax=Gimesia aquarii TaxID=2527964 RepID=A0A517VS59_9PLAN|nr:hypothetical protein [Gimesia aquarii]QDT95854.1 hypothetical protein V144x_13020 [Gimesia aquarii]
MEVALYYPHTTVRTKGVLKTGLLLWDQIHCIIPSDGKFERQRYKKKEYNEAFDLLARNHKPTRDEKRNAHIQLKKFLAEAPPSSFLKDVVTKSRGEYLIYPKKFDKGTWKLLEQHGLAYFDESSSDYALPRVFGLLLMSILADQCAGKQKQKITDHAKVYSWVSQYYANKLGGTYVSGLDASEVGANYERLVTISLQVLGTKNIPIKKLIDMRKREEKSNSGDYRAMRKRYRKALSTYVDRLTNEVETKSDVKEIERQFKEEMKQDLKDLKKELNLSSVKALFSKEMVLTTIAVAGTFIEPISGLTTLATTLQGIGVAPLIKTGAEYRAARSKVLRGSSMSWLYTGEQRPLTLH